MCKVLAQGGFFLPRQQEGKRIVAVHQFSQAVLQGGQSALLTGRADLVYFWCFVIGRVCGGNLAALCHSGPRWMRGKPGLDEARACARGSVTGRRLLLCS